MATKDRTSLKNDFANGKYATGEKFADLIDSMKVVQLPVVDPQALGTSLTFIDSISQDADGKITPTKKTLDLANAHELNPFKGWYKTGDTLPTDGFDGAYLYFKDTSELTGQTTIYRWNGTAYADTGTVVDTSNVQTFGSGQAVNEVYIKDLDGDNDPNAVGVLSAEAGKVLNELIREKRTRLQNYYVGYAITLTLDGYDYVNNRYTQGMVYQDNDWGIMFLHVSEGDEVTVNFGTVGEAASSGPCLVRLDSSRRFFNYWSYNGYTNSRTVTAASEDAIWVIPFKLIKDNGEQNIKPVEINGNAIEISLYHKGDDDKEWHDIEVGGWLQSDTNSSTGNIQDNPNYNSLRCCSACKFVFPHTAAKIRFIDTNNSYITMQLSFIKADGETLTTERYSLRVLAGEIIDVPESAKATRVVFSRRKNYISANASSSPSYFYELTPQELAGVHIQYYSEEEDIFARNIDKVKLVQAGQRKLTLYYDSTDHKNHYDIENNGMNKMPCIGHISDVHGDTVRFGNFMDYCDKFHVDVAIGSGDMVLYNHENGSSYQDKISDKHTTPYLFAIGNHENWPYGQTSVYQDNMSWLATKWGYKLDENNVTDKCYYYKDFSDKKLRVITINYYNDCTYPGRIGQTQAEWFVSTLASTPDGYGIVVVLHSPEDKVVVGEEYNKFHQPWPNTGMGYQPNGFYVGGRPIMSIIDAFISRESGSVSFYDHDIGSTVPSNTGFSETATVVTYDFTDVSESVEFICYCCGHRHEDWVGYYETAQNRQLVLGITCGISLPADTTNYAWAEADDLPRCGEGVAQDAFNLYWIDRHNGVVKIVRIGASVTERFLPRDCMEIPYKDSTQSE